MTVPTQKLPRWPAIALSACLLLSLGACPAPAGDIPRDWVATSLDHCDREPLQLRVPPEAGKPPKSFARNTVRLARDARVAGASARWEFVPLAGVTEAWLDIVASHPGFDGLALWLKNPQGSPLTVALRLVDATGAAFTAPPQPLATSPRWTRYFFALSDLQGPGAGPPLPPFARLQIGLAGLQAQHTQVLYLDELETFAAPPPELRVEGLEAAAQAAAGSSLEVRVTVSASSPILRPVDLTVSLERDGVPATLAHLRATPDTLTSSAPVALSASLPVPRHLADGTYRLRLASSRAKLSGSPGRAVRIVGQSGDTRAAVRCAPEGGAFLVNGQVLPIIGGWQTREHPCRQAPWVLVHLTRDLTPSGEPLAVWMAPDQFDFASADQVLAEILAANPDAYLLPAIHLEAPPWWKQQHPRELMVFGDGKTQLPATVPSFSRTHASWASKVWRQEAAAYLARFVQHLEQGPLGPAVIGYQPAAGEGGHWAYPGASYGVYADYSAPQQEAYREWLKRKYTDVQALRVAWDQPARPDLTPAGLKEARPILGWSQARVPSQGRRAHGSPDVVRDPAAPKEVVQYGALHDPAATEEIVDYQIFASDLVAETIQHFARAVRTATGGKKLTGVEYGLLFDLAGTPGGLQNGGHLAIGPISQAEELDYITSPGTSGAKDGPPLVTIPAATYAAHGKLWVGLAAASRGLGGAVLPLSGGGVVAQEGYTPERWPPALTTVLSGARRHSLSEVAVVVDDISAAYMGCGTELSRPLLDDQRVGLSLLGAPCDVWLLDDVISGRAPRYKLYIFLDAFYLDANSRTQLVQTLNAEPCTALWVYGPGAIDRELGGRTMKDLTGLTLAQRPGRGPVQVKVEGNPGYTYGASSPFFPRFACVDDQADTRGLLVGTQYGGLAVKAYGNIRCYWSAAPHLPAGLLRSIATDAGVSLYATDGDGVYGGGDLLMVRTGGGEHRIRLTQATDVYDLLTGGIQARQAQGFRPTLASGEYGLYYLGITKATTGDR